MGGRGGRSRGPRRGNDIETEVSIGFEDAIEGATVPIKLTRDAPCASCGGSGAEPGTPVETCPACGGSGSVADSQGLFSFVRTCERCGGGGRIVQTPCKTCRGSGVQRRKEEIKVRIPAGVKDGARIRVRGRGVAGGAGGQPGDLYVVVRVAPHTLFGRQGDDLTLNLPVTFTEAALGAQVKVPTLDEPVTVEDPGGNAARQGFPGPRPRRSQAQGQRQRRSARDRERGRPGQAFQEGTRDARGVRRDAPRDSSVAPRGVR